MAGTASTHTRRPERLARLESSAIGALRDAASRGLRPAMLFSAGKDSCVMLRLALKAFAPSVPPFPLLNVDTTWKFPETRSFRDRTAAAAGMELIVQVNRDGAKRGVGPFTHGAREHTRVMKSDALKQALEEYGFDALIDGARGDEESFRTQARMRPSGVQGTTPGAAGGGQPARFFPLADWTEVDVWRYIGLERIEVPRLYFAAERQVVRRNGLLIARIDERMALKAGEEPETACVRFRTLGCWPLTGAVKSEAADIPAILRELRRDTVPERNFRGQDQSAAASPSGEKGYF